MTNIFSFWSSEVWYLLEVDNWRVLPVLPPDHGQVAVEARWGLAYGAAVTVHCLGVAPLLIELPCANSTNMKIPTVANYQPQLYIIKTEYGKTVIIHILCFKKWFKKNSCNKYLCPPPLMSPKGSSISQELGSSVNKHYWGLCVFFLPDSFTRCRARLGAWAFSVASVSASNQPRGHGLRQQSLRP